jgi:cell division protein FtsW
MEKPGRFDSLLVTLTLILVAIGFIILLSASMGLFATGEVSFLSVAVRQLFLGIIGGAIVMYGISKVPYTVWREYALPIFAGAIGITCLTFIPGLSFSHGGATRWIDLGFITVQPVELLKIGFVVYAAGWASYVGDDITDWKYSLLPFGIMLAVISAILLLQPDTGNLVVIAVAGGAIFLAAGACWRHIVYLILLGGAGLGGLMLWRPYIQERIMTFLEPAVNPFGAGYQIQQSLIAIGSGQWLGRGFGQSIQKFNFLPEPVSDSIFAVFAEEWGFVGSALLLILFTAFILRGYKIAADSPDQFSRLLVVGLVSLIAAQVFINVGAMLGVLPLTGLPLTFISHGGTAIMASLVSVGIILNVSRYT